MADRGALASSSSRADDDDGDDDGDGGGGNDDDDEDDDDEDDDRSCAGGLGGDESGATVSTFSTNNRDCVMRTPFSSASGRNGFSSISIIELPPLLVRLPPLGVFFPLPELLGCGVFCGDNEKKLRKLNSVVPFCRRCSSVNLSRKIRIVSTSSIVKAVSWLKVNAAEGSLAFRIELRISSKILVRNALLNSKNSGVSS